MGATIHEVLDGLGAWSFDLKHWDPDLAAECARNRIVLVSEGERPMYALLILTDAPSEARPSIGGQFPDWRLGAGDTGPRVLRPEWVAGTDKLDDGPFEFGPLYYRLGQGTNWLLPEGGPASVSADGAKDDVLEVDRQYPVVEGQQYRVTAVLLRSGGTGPGRARVRALLDGRFATPNLLTNGDLSLGPGHGWGTATDIAIEVDPHDPTKYAMRIGPSTQPDGLAATGGFEDVGAGLTITSNTNLDPVSSVVNDPARARTGDYLLLLGTTRKRACYNGEFELLDALGANNLEGWSSLGGSWTADFTNRDGDFSAQVGSGPGAMQAVRPAEQPGPSAFATTAVEGEKWRMEGYVANDIANPTDGNAWLEVQTSDVGSTRTSFFRANKGNVSTNFEWQKSQMDFEIPANEPIIRFFVEAAFTTGFWYFDDVTCERIEGNEELVVFPAVTVAAGQEWHPVVYAKSAPAFLAGGLFPRVRLTGAGKPDIVKEFNPVSLTAGEWYITWDSITIDDGYTSAVLELRGRDIVGDWIQVDDCSFIRTKGNNDQLVHDVFAVTPERAYRVTADIEVGAGVSGGEVTLVATLTAPGRTDVVVESSPIKITDVGQVLSLDVTPSSGYDALALAVKGTDVIGGSLWARNFEVHDQDAATLVIHDEVVAGTGEATYTFDMTVPAGAHQLHLQAVAESLAAGWELGEWHLQRIGVTPTTKGDVVTELLVDADTGTQLLDVGTVHGPDTVITHDRTIPKTHNLEELVTVLQGGLLPELQEYRVAVAVDDAGAVHVSVDVGSATELFEDRENMVFARDDLKVVEQPGVTEDATPYASHIEVVGAQRQTATGDTVTISAIAEVPWPDPLLNDDGSPLHRVKTVNDSSATHPRYAQALADFLAAEMAGSAQAVTLKVSDTRAYGDFAVGDWIYPYLPEAGLVSNDEMPADDGTVVFPKRSRVIERQLTLGDGDWKAEILRPGQDPLDITDDVLWSGETSAEVTVGSRVPAFNLDDEGGAAFTQLRRFLTSIPTV